jgi:hypothetical protein
MKDQTACIKESVQLNTCFAWHHNLAAFTFSKAAITHLISKGLQESLSHGNQKDIPGARTATSCDWLGRTRGDI